MLLIIPDRALSKREGRVESPVALCNQAIELARRIRQTGERAVQHELDRVGRHEAYAMSIDPGDYGAAVVWQYKRVVAVEKVSTCRDKQAYNVIDAICQQYHVSQAWIEDQFLWSGKLIPLVRNSGIWETCLYRYGCQQLEWIPVRKWQAWRDTHRLGTQGLRQHALAAYHIGMYGQRLVA